MANTGTASLMIAELREFASFAPAEQRYIKRSLDVGLGRRDAFRLWARDAAERASIRRQYEVYRELDSLRAGGPADAKDAAFAAFLARLVGVTVFDLVQNRLSSFSAYRFLYERLLGAQIRPWLPAAFCAAAALPLVKPERRRILLQSISETAVTAPGWSTRPPCVFPEWVEKEAA